MGIAALVLAGIVALAEPGEPFRFCWSASARATGYRLYWSTIPDTWPVERMVDTSDLCVDDHARDPYPGECLYYVVTAYNSAGESETEHGPII
jgi:hypothetical protein